MSLFTKEQMEQLFKNGANRGCDHKPVVKLFLLDAGFTWLICELDPDNPDLAFGLCDLGMGFPELGDVYLPEIIALKGELGLAVERDLHFVGLYPISIYADAARSKSEITLNDTFLRLIKKAKEQ